MTARTKSSSSIRLKPATVRTIFTRYLALKSFQKLINELNDKGIVTKKRAIVGKVAGGIPFTYGPLAYLLKTVLISVRPATTGIGFAARMSRSSLWGSLKKFSVF